MGRQVVDLAKIARQCHEVNRAYCLGIGDHAVSWEEASDAIKQSAINGVKYALENPHATPEQMHENWKKEKVAAGWVYGEVKDESKKTHPCIVAYSELPIAQRIKDNLFQAVVHNAV